jgi:hypothetical protein
VRGHTAPCLQWDGAWLGECVQCHRVSQGAQLTGERRVVALLYLLSSVSSHARRRDTHHTARAVLSAGTSTNTGGQWHADTR